MSTPGTLEGSVANNAPSFEQQVNDAVANATRTADGKRLLPDELPEAVKYAANIELRRRDTESALGKAKHQLKAQEVLTSKLTERTVDYARTVIPAEMQTKLEELKYSDPEAWRREINAYEQRASAEATKQVNDLALSASQQIELENRQRMLDEYNAANPEFALSDEVLVNDLPPRLVKRLETGELTFEGFLSEAKKHLSKSVVVGGGAKAEHLPNLGNVGGGATPGIDAAAGYLANSYETTLF